jgi:hypothetical protein
MHLRSLASVVVQSLSMPTDHSFLKAALAGYLHQHCGRSSCFRSGLVRGL